MPTERPTDGCIFVTLEGVDGSGKTTQVAYASRLLQSCGYDVVCLREPGGTALSEKIRSILLDPSHGEMADECELLLMEASRAQLVRQVIEPALASGKAVLCDRFFDSTLAYQAGGRGIPEEQVAAANALGSCGLVPDLTLVLDIDPVHALKRATRDGMDRLEGEGLAFQQRIRESYLRLAEREPGRVRVIDAAGTPGEVAERIEVELRALLTRRGSEMVSQTQTDGMEGYQGAQPHDTRSVASSERATTQEVRLATPGAACRGLVLAGGDEE